MMKNKRRISIRKVILQPSNMVQEGRGGGRTTDCWDWNHQTYCMYTPHRPINTWRGDASAIAITRRGLFFFSFSIPRDKRSRTWFVSTPSPRYSTATRQTIANDAFLTRVWNKCAVCPEFVVTRGGKKICLWLRGEYQRSYTPASPALHTVW
jgi:hypothetical protein